MRVSVFVGASLDGFIARKDGDLEFLDQGPPVDNGYARFVRTVDVHAIGRGTYDWVRAWMRRTGGAWPYEAPVIVLTHRAGSLRPAKGTRVEAMAADPRTVVRRLARRGYHHLYVDGGATIQEFLRAGCVDRIVVTRVPVLIGSGVPLFGPLRRDVLLRHVRTRTLRGGPVQSEYLVRRR